MASEEEQAVDYSDRNGTPLSPPSSPPSPPPCPALPGLPFLSVGGEWGVGGGEGY